MSENDFFHLCVLGAIFHHYRKFLALGAGFRFAPMKNKSNRLEWKYLCSKNLFPTITPVLSSYIRSIRSKEKKSWQSSWISTAFVVGSFGDSVRRKRLIEIKWLRLVGASRRDLSAACRSVAATYFCFAVSAIYPSHVIVLNERNEPETLFKRYLAIGTGWIYCSNLCV